MQDKLIAVSVVSIIIILIPVLASLVWILLAGLIGYLLWNRKRLERIVADLKDILSGNTGEK